MNFSSMPWGWRNRCYFSISKWRITRLIWSISLASSKSATTFLHFNVADLTNTYACITRLTNNIFFFNDKLLLECLYAFSSIPEIPFWILQLRLNKIQWPRFFMIFLTVRFTCLNYKYNNWISLDIRMKDWNCGKVHFRKLNN